MDRNRIIKSLAKSTIKADGQRTEYKVLKELGRGGNGVAFVVKSPSRELVAKFYVPPDARDLDDAATKRFEREMELAARVSHPYVLASAGVGKAQIGAYQIPFYLMPQATKAFRTVVPRSFSLNNLGGMRRFTRVMQGACYLHHCGIVHRDLKPENILLFGDVPKISDLGIAHVSPQSANVSLLTVPNDQLRNRDYYAPEQRDADATKVDHRADIYALGCIFYELVSGITPTRPNLPRLEELDKRFAPLDKLFSKMTAHDPRRRYQQLDEALDDLFWALVEIGDVAVAATTSPEDDEKLLLKLLTSANGLHQKKAAEPALRLGERALPLLHNALGNRRLDVVAGAYKILGELAHESSTPFLTSGLYARYTSSKPRYPTGEVAATAIRKYEPAVRLKILDSLIEPVRADDIEIIIGEIGSSETYDRVLKLHRKNMFFTDWGINQGISLLLKIDQEKAWPVVEEMMARNQDFYFFSVQKVIYPYVGLQRKQRLIDHFLARPSSLSVWNLRSITDLICNGELPEQYVSKTLDRLGPVAHAAIKKYADRREFEKYVRDARNRRQPDQIGSAAPLTAPEPPSQSGNVPIAGPTTPRIP